MRLTVEPDETDKKLEEYRLVDVIGEGGLSKVFAWYDNEWGYANRLLDLCESFSASTT